MGAEMPTNKDASERDGPDIIFLVLTYTTFIAIAVCTISLIWVVGSATVNLVSFATKLLDGPPISAWRWTTASAFMLIGVVGHLQHLALLRHRTI